MSITVPWDSKFEIGHERIDAEHRIFLSLIRDLSLEAETGASDERVRRTLREIFKYADFHFTSEENIMVDIAYPELASHRDAHARLLAQLTDKIYDYRTEAVETAEIVLFLFQWFALHTTQVDKRITDFLSPPSPAGFPL